MKCIKDGHEIIECKKEVCDQWHGPLKLEETAINVIFRIIQTDYPYCVSCWYNNEVRNSILKDLLDGKFKKEYLQVPPEDLEGLHLE